MKETRTKKQSEISSWLNKSRKLEKERVLQLSKICEEQVFHLSRAFNMLQHCFSYFFFNFFCILCM